MKTCYIVRGLPSSGKSTFAKSIVDMHPRTSVLCEADQYFVHPNGEYIFDATKLGSAHKFCMDKFTSAIDSATEVVVVSNTNTQLREFNKYKSYAEEHGYTVFVIIVENYHGNKNDHNVPDETVKNMKNRFIINL
jgi:uridine kinase